MNRIETIVSCISSNDKIADIGCDQIEVGVLLAKKGIKSIASDISINVVNEARKKLEKLDLEEYIDLRVGNGLESIKQDDANALVLAGMGAYTIIDILSNSNKIYNKIITISNNNNDLLRDKMNDLGYKVDYEIIIKERKKYYNLIVFIPGNYNYTEKELLLGLNHKNLETFNEWKEYLLQKYKKIQNESKDKNNKINTIIKYLEDY